MEDTMAIAWKLGRCSAFALMLSGATPLTALAADFPTRAVTLVLGFSPGGPSDVLARVLGRRMEQALGRPVIIENRAGAGGNLAGELVARANPDGHTLLLGTNGILAINASLYPKIGFDPAKDFQAITLIGFQANVLYVHPSIPSKIFAEFLTHARANPGKLSYATGGNGTTAHLAGELLKTEGKLDITHVPYKGTGPAMQSVLAGHVPIGISPVAPIVPHFKSGSLRPLGVTTLKRTGPLPETGTIAELGLPGFEATTWHGLVAPAGTPADVVAILHRAMTATLNDVEVRKQLVNLGVDLSGIGPEEFGAYIKTEVPKWTAIVRASGAKAN
jgi:tripartite-type tricarboxylate transporter receptor subunit TctC